MAGSPPAADLEHERGALPAFFEPAFANPDVLRGLRQQTRFGWVESPVPVGFRFALLQALAERSPWPWRAVADEADRLPRIRQSAADGWPVDGGAEHDELLALTLQLIVEGPEESVRRRLQALLGWSRYASLIAVLTYLETCRTFAQADPGLAAAASLRYRPAADPGALAIFEVDQRGSIVSCNSEVERLFGTPAPALTGTPFHRLFADVQAQALERCIEELGDDQAPAREHSLRLLARRADDSTFEAVVTVAKAGRERSPGRLKAVVDVDPLGSRDAYRSAYQLLISTAQGQLSRAREGHPLAALARTLGWEHMLIWRADSGDGLIHCTGVHHLGGEPSAEIDERASAAETPGEGPVGSAFQTGVPEWRADLEGREDSGIVSWIWLPIGSHGEVEGVVELMSSRARAPDPALLEVLSTLTRGARSALDPDATTEADWRAASDAPAAAAENLAFEALAFEAAPVGMALVSVEPGREGEITEVNRAMALLSGREEADLIGASIADFSHPGDADLDAELEAQLLAGTIPSYGIEKRFRRADGQVFWGELTVSLIRGDDQTHRPMYVVVQLADVTERKELEEALLVSRDRLASVFEEAPAGMGLATLDGRWLQVNDALCQMLGYTEAAMLDKRLTDVIVRDEVETIERYLNELLTDELLGYHVETQTVGADGEVLWVQLSVSLIHNYDGTPAYVFAELEDVSERKRLEDELARGVLVDAVTGLPSRTLLFDRLEQAHARLERTGMPFVVMFVAVGGFGEVTESSGSEHADAVLKELAARLLTAVRSGDTVARYSDTEFVIVCEDLASHAEADAIASRIAAVGDVPVLTGADVITPELAVGITVAYESAAVTAALVERADAAMHAARQQGAAYLEYHESL